MRDDYFLIRKFNEVWNLYFPEVEKKNRILVRFKGKWKNKFGHIKKIKDDTEIVVNGIFRDLRIPEFMIEVTLAHELVHYMHGFSSPYTRKYKYPHKGSIVRKELIKRGFKNMLKLEREFVKKEWPKILKDYFPRFSFKKGYRMYFLQLRQ